MNAHSREFQELAINSQFLKDLDKQKHLDFETLLEGSILRFTIESVKAIIFYFQTQNIGVQPQLQSFKKSFGRKIRRSANRLTGADYQYPNFLLGVYDWIIPFYTPAYGGLTFLTIRISKEEDVYQIFAIQSETGFLGYHHGWDYYDESNHDKSSSDLEEGGEKVLELDEVTPLVETDCTGIITNSSQFEEDVVENPDRHDEDNAILEVELSSENDAEVSEGTQAKVDIDDYALWFNDDFVFNEKVFQYLIPALVLKQILEVLLEYDSYPFPESKAYFLSLVKKFVTECKSTRIDYDFLESVDIGYEELVNVKTFQCLESLPLVFAVHQVDGVRHVFFARVGKAIELYSMKKLRAFEHINDLQLNWKHDTMPIFISKQMQSILYKHVVRVEDREVEYHQFYDMMQKCVNEMELYETRDEIGVQKDYLYISFHSEYLDCFFFVAKELTRYSLRAVFSRRKFEDIKLNKFKSYWADRWLNKKPILVTLHAIERFIQRVLETTVDDVTFDSVSGDIKVILESMTLCKNFKRKFPFMVKLNNGLDSNVHYYRAKSHQKDIVLVLLEKDNMYVIKTVMFK